MKIIDYNDIISEPSIIQLKCNTFESNVYIGTNDKLYKIFKISGTKYNQTGYLEGKRQKAILLSKFFEDDNHIVTPCGLIYDKEQFKGLVYPYKKNAYPISRYICDRKISLDDKIYIFRDISQIIRKMHKFNCYHADLGASNILLDSKENVHIIDLDNSKVESINADGRNHLAIYLINSFRYPTKVDENLDNLTLMITFLNLFIGQDRLKDYLINRPVVFENSEIRKIAMIVKECLSQKRSVPYFDDIEIFLDYCI